MRTLIFVTALLVFTSCSGSAPEVAEKPVTNTKDQSKRVSDTVASHTLEKEKRPKAKTEMPEPPEPAKKKRKWSRSGDAIDTTKFDNAVKAAGDDKAALAKAYFGRGVALTAARQYASAIGDFRKALENDPDHADAKKQIAMITSIYNSMNIEAPAKGEEPPPLEFTKQKD